MTNEIRSFFEDYRDAFNALDGVAVADLYAEPSGIAQGAIYTHWPTRQPVADNMRALCEIYRGRGFMRADFRPGHFIEQGADHAVAEVIWRIDWSRGDAPWEFKTTYNLIRTGDGWRVLLCTAYDEASLHAEKPAV